jgi:hypothetical protein
MKRRGEAGLLPKLIQTTSTYTRVTGVPRDHCLFPCFADLASHCCSLVPLDNSSLVQSSRGLQLPHTIEMAGRTLAELKLCKVEAEDETRCDFCAYYSFSRLARVYVRPHQWPDENSMVGLSVRFSQYCQ